MDNEGSSLPSGNREYGFVHHRLDVYRVSYEMLMKVQALAERIPRGYRSFADQLLRAAGSTLGLIGEGANRFTKGQKRQRFTEARGEAGHAFEARDWIVVADFEGPPEDPQLPLAFREALTVDLQQSRHINS